MIKKLFYVVTLVVLMGCKSKSVTNTKVDNATERILKGDWILSKVSYPGSDFIKVESFQIADSNCFEGSLWNFISNNNKGNMQLNKTGCVAFNSPITWFINKENQFVLKILNAGEKAKRVKEGYILMVRNVSETSFQLVDTANIGGKSTEIVYQFNKK